MTIAIGDRIPDVQVMTSRPEGPVPVQTGEVLGHGKVVLFAVPGAFTPDLLRLPPPELRHPLRRPEGQGRRLHRLRLGQRPIRHGGVGRGAARRRPRARSWPTATGTSPRPWAWSWTEAPSAWERGRNGMRRSSRMGWSTSLQVEPGPGLSVSAADAMLELL